MNRMVLTQIAGVQRHLTFSISCMFDMQEQYGNIQKSLEIIQADNRDAFDAVRWFAVRMANEGELCRRNAGYEPLPMAEEKDIASTMSPYEYAQLRDAVVDAIAAGYKREVKDDKETDLGLEELNAKKTEAGASGHSTTTSP